MGQTSSVFLRRLLLLVQAIAQFLRPRVLLFCAHKRRLCAARLDMVGIVRQRIVLAIEDGLRFLDEMTPVLHIALCLGNAHAQRFAFQVLASAPC